jgi:hypothetical protein
VGEVEGCLGGGHVEHKVALEVYEERRSPQVYPKLTNRNIHRAQRVGCARGYPLANELWNSDGGRPCSFWCSIAVVHR